MTTPADFVSSSLGLSLGEMRRRVRLHLDAVQVDSAGTSFNDPFWSDEKIDMGIEEGYDHFLQMLAMSYEGDLEQEFLLAIQAGVESYHLPYNVAKVTGVFLKDITDDDLWLPLQYSRRHDMRLEGADDGYSPSLPCYFFRGRALYLNPTPSTDQRVGLKIVAAVYPPVLTNEGDRPIPEFLRFWHHLIVRWAAEVMLQIDRSDTTAMERRRAEMQGVFINFLEQRSTAPQYIGIGWDGSIY